MLPAECFFFWKDVHDSCSTPLSLTAMLTDAACQFCTASFSLHESSPTARTRQQLFVTASVQQLLIYILNLVVMAALLPQHQLKIVPVLVAMFIFGRFGCFTNALICDLFPSWLHRQIHETL